MQKMADGGLLVEWSEGLGGSLTGTAATSLHQVCSCMCPSTHNMMQMLLSRITVKRVCMAATDTDVGADPVHVTGPSCVFLLTVNECTCMSP